jgi:hypothetical protein
MPDFDLKIDLILQGPVLSHSTAVGASGVSSPFARNSKDEYYLPGTLIKGRLRQAWNELHSAVGASFQPALTDLLGESSDHPQARPTAVDPLRGSLYFDDFTNQAKDREDTRYRIGIDGERGAVKKGFYQVLDAPYKVGESVKFSGAIRFSASDTASANNIKREIEIGLRWITSLGAERSVGFGRLLEVKVSAPQQTAIAAKQSATGATTLSLKLSPNAPFCLSRRRIDPNLFESDTIIAGAAIKGSLAGSWRALLGQSPNGVITPTLDPSRLELCRNFEKIRFTHAFPAGQAARPVTAPLSLVKANKIQLYDVALAANPMLVGNPLAAPEFSVDWKSDNDVQQRFGWAELDRELRVRTAIDADRRKAKDEQLFAYEKIVPKDVNWYCQIDLGAVPDGERRAVEGQLLDLLANGLRAMGKTKARVTVEVNATAIPASHPSKTAPRDGVWIVTLQTPALVCDQTAVISSGLLAAYREVFSQLSGNSLTLQHFFAQQSLAGGNYLWKRFQPGRDYSPWLLTNAGSVFVLKAASGKESEAQKCIDQWLAHGLPLPDWAAARYGNHWTTCPFLPEGGYGEIAVNLDIHWANYPKQGEAYVIS